MVRGKARRVRGNGRSRSSLPKIYTVNDGDKIYMHGLTKLNRLIDNDLKKERSLPTLESKDNYFNLKEVPIYYPNEEEFNNIELFISSIREEAETYGMCKVVPPESWKPSFSVDLENYEFPTHVQKLNYLGAEARAAHNFSEKVRIFFAQQNQNQSQFRVPILYGKPLNLYNLNNIIIKFGGFNHIIQNKLWSQVGRALGYDPTEQTSLSFNLKKNYEIMLQAFNNYISYSGQLLDSDDEIKKNNNLIGVCRLCMSNNKKGLISCIQCKRHFHPTCFKLNLNDGFYCPICLDNYLPNFGFSDGSTYHLSEFMAKSHRFYDNYLTNLPNNNIKNPNLWLEKKFWEHINTPFEDISVEYANDLPSTFNGSGFSTSEISPKDNISEHSWNLNNIGKNSNNLFSQLNEKNSGMNVPWSFITMLFSTHCWHIDDHFSYSINYQHFGSSKRYYSIPAKYSQHFETIFKNSAPSLFKNDPELLYQLITMISPQHLIDNNIPIYTIEQNAKEFIITFPKSYSTWYSNGFSFNEAVYYAPADWLYYGNLSNSQYQLLNRQTVFSFDKLIIDLANNNPTIEVALHLLPCLEELKVKEMNSRIMANILQPIHSYDASFNDTSDLIQCQQCNIFCYLSHVQCSCNPNKVSCLLHIFNCCECSKPKQLITHVKDDLLIDLIYKLKEIIAPLYAWRANYQNIMSNCKSIHIDKIEQLIIDSNTISCNLTELILLKDRKHRYYEWENRVAPILEYITTDVITSELDFEFECDLIIYMKELKKEVEFLAVTSSKVETFIKFMHEVDTYVLQMGQAIVRGEYTNSLQLQKISQKIQLWFQPNKIEDIKQCNKELLKVWENETNTLLSSKQSNINKLVFQANLATELCVDKKHPILIDLLKFINSVRI